MQIINEHSEIKGVELNVSRFQFVESKKEAKDEFRRRTVLDLMERINPSLVSAGYKPYDFARMRGKVKHLSDFDLGWHIRECEKSSNFGKCFFGKLKVKK